VRGRWTYLYRAVDKQGRTVEFLLSPVAGFRCSETILSEGVNGTERLITLDAYAASHRALRELKTAGKMPKRVRVRSCKYLSNVIEQDHRRVKQRIGPMLGFKRFDTAALTISALNSQRKSGRDN
jgi:transposase-like protein